jgi:hypothetical protein
VTGCPPFRPPQTHPSDAEKPASAHSPWPALGRLDSVQARAAGSPARMDIDTGSGSVTSAATSDHFEGRAGSVSLDDPDVRLAAEALGDLRSGMFH